MLRSLQSKTELWIADNHFQELWAALDLYFAFFVYVEVIPGLVHVLFEILIEFLSFKSIVSLDGFFGSSYGSFFVKEYFSGRLSAVWVLSNEMDRLFPVGR